MNWKNIYYIMVNELGQIYRLRIYESPYMIDIEVMSVTEGSYIWYRLWSDGREELNLYLAWLTSIDFEYEERPPDSLVEKVLDAIEFLVKEAKVIAEFEGEE